MTGDAVATVLTGLGVVIAVWGLVDRKVDRLRTDLTGQVRAGIDTLRTDLTGQVDRVRTEIDTLRTDLAGQVEAVRTRIDNILLAEGKRPRAAQRRRKSGKPIRPAGPGVGF